MIVYPILNFVLPLILSSFILVNEPLRCTACQNKTEQKVVGNVANEKSLEINAEVNGAESFCYERLEGCKEREKQRY